MIIIRPILRHTLIQGLFITCSTVNLFCGSVLNRPLISSLAGDERRKANNYMYRRVITRYCIREIKCNWFMTWQELFSRVLDSQACVRKKAKATLSRVYSTSCHEPNSSWVFPLFSDRMIRIGNLSRSAFFFALFYSNEYCLPSNMTRYDKVRK